MAAPTDRSQLALVEPTPDTIEGDHVIQRALCCDLEALADGLPALPPSAAIRRLCARVTGITTVHFARAERVVARLPAGARPDAAALAGLREMHALDAAHGDDLLTALRDRLGPLPDAQAGQLAYMLRCFFDGCRRAIALKESWLAAARRADVTPD